MPHTQPGPAFARLSIAVLLTVAVVLSAMSVPTRAQQPQIAVGIDADATGNSATALGSIDECVEISEGAEHDVDVFIQNITDLIAWEAMLTFDTAVIELIDEDTTLFMAANEGSDAHDITEAIPDGRYQLGAFDASDPPASDSGSGVLARLTFKAVAPGVSEIRLPLADLDGDGRPDRGPLLRNVDGDVIGDVDDDTLFDGPNAEARIAVDSSCDDPPGPVIQTDREDSEEDGLEAITVVVALAGLLASVGVGAVVAWAVIRFRGRQGA
jgi:hypothetical protein